MSKEMIYITLFIILALASPLVSLPAILKIIRIRRTATYYISALPSGGEVEIVGKAKGTPVPSPFRQKDCLVWNVEVEERHITPAHYDQGHVHNGRREAGHYHPEKETWSTVYKNTSELPFIVSDGTGEIPISIKHLQLDADKEKYDAFTPENYRTFEKLGVKTHDGSGVAKTLRVTEELICPDDEVFISGELDTTEGGKTITSLSHPLVISKHGEKEILSRLYRSVIIFTLAFIGVCAVALYFLYSRF